jgi:single-strand DNA-binding protein
MPDLITLTGVIGTDPRVIVTGEGLNITSFRLASKQRKFSRADNAWVDGETNWYTVSTFRQLAVNAASSVRKGDRVVVSGRLKIREWQSGEKAGMTIEVDADAVGHDLTFGTTSYSRTLSAAAAAPDAATNAQPDEEGFPPGDDADSAASDDVPSPSSAASEDVPVPF